MDSCNLIYLSIWHVPLAFDRIPLIFEMAGSITIICLKVSRTLLRPLAQLCF